VFTSSLIPAIILHALWYFLASALTAYQVDLEVLGRLFSTHENIGKAFRNIQDFDLQIILYQVSILFFAAVLGFSSKYIVRKFKWDRRSKLFRFQNGWHYLFTGEFFDFPKASFDLEVDKVDQIELVYVDILVDAKEGSILYEGILVDYELSKDGGLGYVILKETIRRFLIPEGAYLVDEKDLLQENYANTELLNPNKFYNPIKGHIVVIPNKDIKNINFSYYKIEETDGAYDVGIVE